METEIFITDHYRWIDEITTVFRDILNHFTGEYIKNENMWSPMEYDEWQSNEFDKGKDYEYYNELN
jgi:hypothetical protein